MFGLADHENYKRFYEFPVDSQSGINKPITKPMTAWQLNPRGSTLNQNSNSDVGTNQSQRWFQNVPTSRNDIQIW